jgi:methyl-accepting chemotaxis protein
MVVVILVVVIASLSIITLKQSTAMQTSAAYDHALQIANTQSLDIKRRVEDYIMTVKQLAQIFGEFDTLPPEMRRPLFDDMLLSLMNRNQNFTGLWTAWLPNALDGLDAQRGQYHTSFTRRNGPVEKMPDGFEGWEDYLNTVLKDPAAAAMTAPEWRQISGHGEVPVVTIMYTITTGRNNTPVGIVGINYITAMQGIADEISRQLYNGKGIAGIYTSDGVIVGHWDKKRVKQNVKDSEAEKTLLGDRIGDVINALKDDSEILTLTRYSHILETDMHLIYYPITFEDVAHPWNLFVGVPMSEVTRASRELTYFTVLLAAGFILASVIASIITATRIVKPILRVTSMLKDISEGEGDLTKRLNTQGKDEIGEMSGYFNQTLDKIRNLVVIIKNQAVDLENIGMKLAANMSQTAAAMNEISANVDSVKNQVINQSASVTETNSTMEQITLNINKLNEQIENQTRSVTQSSSAVEEMLANIASVTQTLVKNSDNVTSLAHAAESGRTDLHVVVTDIQEIAKESEGLLEINAMMQNIASQTNLLSMNAAIEAAHAGEAGKGFAVVADEIRKLAESSGEQAKTTSVVLKKIKDSVDKITVSTEAVLKKFEAIDSGVKTVSDQEENIRNAMEEQSEGSKQVLEAVSDLNQVTQRVRSSSEEMLLGSQQVIEESKNLGRISQEIADSMNEMTAGAQEITRAMNEVNDVSAQNKESIATLVGEVGKFKVE